MEVNISNVQVREMYIMAIKAIEDLELLDVYKINAGINMDVFMKLYEQGSPMTDLELMYSFLKHIQTGIHMEGLGVFTIENDDLNVFREDQGRHVVSFYASMFNFDDKNPNIRLL